ncbi:D-2-hydroxyacid dehydrogenase [Amycolatopsis sp. NPDC005232]|uniref:D-2-hydroxyacid dehydrogenase n=1 Tax=Amycolatopsis sp. NPDC005232 TaxID=3157027 RepID=UPI0033BEDDBF
MRIAYWLGTQLARELIVEGLRSVDGAEVVVIEGLADLLEALPELDGLVLRNVPEAEAGQVCDVLRRPGRRLRWMHFVSAGREGFDAAGIPEDILVTGPDGALAPTVAEHAMALLLAIGRQLPACVEAGRSREWKRTMPAGVRSIEGQSLLVVGYGNIGREIAKRAAAFGARITVVTRSPRPDDLVSDVRPLGELRAALAEADSVVIAIALTETTKHLIGSAELAACKPGAHLVNVARGGIVDQRALVEALRSGHIGAAGLDVVDPEPLPSDDPLWECPNVLITGHFAGAGSAFSAKRLARSVVENAAKFVAGAGYVG